MSVMCVCLMKFHLKMFVFRYVVRFRRRISSNWKAFRTTDCSLSSFRFSFLSSSFHTSIFSLFIKAQSTPVIYPANKIPAADFL
jgi:hypothetical protein